MARSALLVDLDGTVWHSAVWYPRLIADATGGEVTEVAHALERKPVARVLADFGVAKARFGRLCDQFVATLTVFEGVRETLTDLDARGVRTGAVTNLPGWVVRPMLAGTQLAPLLHTMVDWSRTSRHKPRPDPLLLALADLNVRPTYRSWYVGDTTSDAEAAAAAGVSFAWAGYASDQTPPHTAGVVLRTFADVAGLFA